MNIRITASCAGQFDGETFAYQPGEVVTVPKPLGDDLIRAGYAEAAEKRSAPKAEKRVRAPKETRA
jgi:hypothetical protein